MNYIESQGNSTCENSAVSSSVSTCNEADVLKLLGIAYLYPYQQLVIANVLDAVTSSDDEIPHAQLVILPTGFGKSVCFQVPALMIRGITIIVYPLKGLIADQARRLSNSPKPVFTVTGDTGQETWNKLKHTVATNPDC
ncbi:MAG TPA: DEAD/DEAH box helicase, partial [Spirochaetales bacterium]|nr:DEAD/DEAH box helicase [Spirochaetales bacterium]